MFRLRIYTFPDLVPMSTTFPDTAECESTIGDAETGLCVRFSGFYFYVAERGEDGVGHYCCGAFVAAAVC